MIKLCVRPPPPTTDVAGVLIRVLLVLSLVIGDKGQSPKMSRKSTVLCTLFIGVDCRYCICFAMDAATSELRFREGEEDAVGAVGTDGVAGIFVVAAGLRLLERLMGFFLDIIECSTALPLPLSLERAGSTFSSLNISGERGGGGGGDAGGGDDVDDDMTTGLAMFNGSLN